MDKYINHLSEILKKNNVCYSHGIDHAISVLNHAKQALKYEPNPSIKEQEAILLAALLHDADDKKFFPDNSNYENVRLILNDKDENFIELVIKMIKLVSASTNGDNIPDDIKDKLWMLIPRYSDRLEAIGLVGIKRCYRYNITINAPLFIDSTPRLTDENEIIRLSLEKYKKYNGSSNSMMDHYYDKLIAITYFPINNKYLEIESNKRRQPLIDFVKYFGENNEIDTTNL